jgi:hypothetical protein
MSRRTKLIILAIFLALLAMPIWHVASNWNPPNPLRFRLLSKQSLPVKDGRKEVRLEVEVLNTTTAPRYLYHAYVKQVEEPLDPFMPSMLLEPRLLIPAGGILRVRAESWCLTEEDITPGPSNVCYLQNSTARERLVSWYGSMIQHFPDTFRSRIEPSLSSECIAPLETTPQDSILSP